MERLSSIWRSSGNRLKALISHQTHILCQLKGIPRDSNKISKVISKNL